MAVRCRTAVVAWQAALFRSHNQTEHQSFSSAASMNGLAPWASCTSLLASLASASSVRLRPMTPTHRLFYGERAPDKTAWDVWYRPQLLRAQPDRLLARLRQGQRWPRPRQQCNLGGIPANGSLKPEPLSISAPRCRSQAPRSIAGSSPSTRILHFDVFYTGGRLYF